MLVKIAETNRTRTYQCTHNQVTYYEDRTEVEIQPQGLTFVLPRDGHAIYVMNDKGDTTDTFRPPKGGRKS